jgi:hypothetical protein
MVELERIVETDKGLDPLYKVETLMTADTLILDNYCQELEKVYVRTKEQGVAARQLNGCLRIFGITREMAKGRGQSAAAHQFFHMANQGRSSALSKSSSVTDQNNETRMLESVPHFVNIVDYNLNVPIADPIFALPNTQMVFDLVIGRVEIFVQFDFEAFFKFARSHGIEIRWIKGKEAGEVKQFSMRIPGTDDCWGILAELPSGERETLLAAFLGRPFSNFTTPLQLVKMIKDWPQQLAKADPNKKLESPI